MDSLINRKRPAIRTSDEHGGDASVDRDTLPPSGGRRRSILDTDETVGLVSVLYHAQQGVLAADLAVDEARDVNDSELVQFLEATEREAAARADQAKRLLFARLQVEFADEARRAVHEAPHGRVHYVSVPDEPLSPLNSE
ncbi:MAG: hypothetical protein ABW061_15210 [Polyangiaceae bacterium]